MALKKRVGCTPERRVLFHTDDAGLCQSANRGAIEAMEHGLAKSMSLMAVCPAFPEMAAWLRQHPDADAGIHLTLTSEFTGFRWEPLTSAQEAPGLRAEDGALHPDTASLAAHAHPDEVRREIHAQVRAAREEGLKPSHMDCHMASVFAHPPFFRAFIETGAELGIPVLVEGAGLSRSARLRRKLKRIRQRLAGQESADFPYPPADLIARARDLGHPAVDHIHADSYVWPAPEKTARFLELAGTLPPGLTVVLVHCARPEGDLDLLEGTGANRCADTGVMMSPRLRSALAEAGVRVTSWRETAAESPLLNADAP
jgi:chitin disaccharide deacetylase